MTLLCYCLDFLPYGEAAGDVVGLSGDDLLLAVVENPVGFTCGPSLSHSVYVRYSVTKQQTHLVCE
jgi:hypothetical protein